MVNCYVEALHGLNVVFTFFVLDLSGLGTPPHPDFMNPPKSGEKTSCSWSLFIFFDLIYHSSIWMVSSTNISKVQI